MAASFLKRKPKEPDEPQRREISVLEADAETGLSAAQAQERLDGGWGNAPVESPRVGPGDHRKKRFYVL